MSRSLRILVVQNVPHTLRGGMSRMLGLIHDRVIQDGHTVEFFSSDQLAANHNPRYARLTFPYAALAHARRAARAGRPYDVINVHEPSAGLIVALKRFAGNPLVAVTTHGLEERGWAAAREDARLGRMPLAWKTRLIFPPTVLWPCAFALRRADHVFCLNEEDKRYLETRYRVPTERITKMVPGADADYLAAFSRRDYAEQPPRILWFGTWLPRKGAQDAVDSFAALASTFPQLTFAVMGAGLPREDVLASFPEALRDRVHYIPFMAGAGGPAAEMLRSCAYLLPSVFEGTPQTLVETMATGLPAVTTATCGMKDVIVDGKNGLLVPIRAPRELAAALTRLLSDRDLWERLGRQAHADVVMNYTWDKVAEPVRLAYHRLAQARGREKR